MSSVQPCGDAVHRHQEPLAVGLARSKESEHCGDILSRACWSDWLDSGGSEVLSHGDRPTQTLNVCKACDCQSCVLIFRVIMAPGTGRGAGVLNEES